MKNKFNKHLLTVLFTVSFIFQAVNCFSQGAAINTSGANADASAGLDINFNDKGLLIPRMTTAERDLILNPAIGLMIFNLDCFNFDYFNGNGWAALNQIIAGININANPTGAICAGTNVTFTATPVNGGTSPSYQWKLNGANVGTNNNTYTNSSLNNGDVIICELTSNANCISGNPTISNFITMVVSQPPTIADAGTDQSLCNVTTTTLSANIPSVGAGLWSVVSGNANITTPTSPTSGVTGLIPGTATLRWTIANSPCPDSYDDVNITVVQPPTVANAGSDINPACGVTTATLSGNTPSVGTGSWSVVSGTATITNPSSPTSGVTGLVIPSIFGQSITATLRWTISNPPCAYSYDDVVITTTKCWSCGDNLTDSRDANNYQTVLIGTQCWMKENLKYDQNSYGNDWCYDNNPSWCNTYGRLYDWTAAMAGSSSSNNNPSGVKGVCPTGWHLPSDNEWKQLELFLGMSSSVIDNTGFRGTNQGSQLKSTSGWDSSGNGTNTSGFTALPSGRRYYTYFDLRGSNCFFWTSTENNLDNAWQRNLVDYQSKIYRSDYGKTYSGLSVRCVKD